MRGSPPYTARLRLPRAPRARGRGHPHKHWHHVFPLSFLLRISSHLPEPNWQAMAAAGCQRGGGRGSAIPSPTSDWWFPQRWGQLGLTLKYTYSSLYPMNSFWNTQLRSEKPVNKKRLPLIVIGKLQCIPSQVKICKCGQKNVLLEQWKQAYKNNNFRGIENKYTLFMWPN